MSKSYYHPIDMVTGYVDNEPTRDPQLALSPKPDTIGGFSTPEAAAEWATAKGFQVVTLQEGLRAIFG